MKKTKRARTKNVQTEWWAQFLNRSFVSVYSFLVRCLPAFLQTIEKTSVDWCNPIVWECHAQAHAWIKTRQRERERESAKKKYIFSVAEHGTRDRIETALCAQLRCLTNANKYPYLFDWLVRQKRPEEYKTLSEICLNTNATSSPHLAHSQIECVPEYVDDNTLDFATHAVCHKFAPVRESNFLRNAAKLTYCRPKRAPAHTINHTFAVGQTKKKIGLIVGKR